MARLRGPKKLVVEVEEDRPVDLADAREQLRLLRPRLTGLRTRGLRRLEHPEVLSLALVAASKRVAPGEGREWNFVSELVDRANGRHYRLFGPLHAPERATLQSTRVPAPPRPEELAAAMEALAKHPQIGKGIKAGALTVVAGMPGARIVRDGDGRGSRVITMAVRGELGDGGVSRIVEVDTHTGTVMASGRAAPSAECGVPDDGGSGDGSTGGQVRVTVRQGAEVLWTMVVIRPAAHEADGGVGLSVRQVDYRGKRVLFRGDTPIVNVKYDRKNQSGAVTYRDWLNEEAPFRAAGTDVIPGYRLCQVAPKTLFDVNARGKARAGGGFTGVTVHWDGTTLVLTTLMAAGWYRYRAEWRFAADGTITPTFGFNAVTNENTCYPHTHHCYWRLDFDIETAAGNSVERRITHVEAPHFDLADVHTVQQRLGALSTQWVAVKKERRMIHGPLSAWRVSNEKSGRGYTIYPGLRDGAAEPGFGVGDVWAVRYRQSEDKDAGGTGDRAHLDPYVNDESITRTDVVLWYAAHGRHDQHEDDLHGLHGHVVGPKLVPHNW